MVYVFELFINKDKVTKEEFSAFYTVLSGYLGSFKNIKFHILLSDNHIRYFIQSDRDLSAMSSSVSFCVLRPVDESVVAIPNHISKERFVNFVNGGSLLDLREKISVKRGKSLDHIICDVKRITSKRAHTNIKMYFKNAGDEWSLSKKLTNKFPAHLFAVDFASANNFMKSETPKYLSIEKVLHSIVPENINGLLEVNTFPYFARPYFLNLPAYEFDKHSMIVGSSGSGKSKFIELFIDRLYRLPTRQDYRVIIIDPHASLAKDLMHVGDPKIIDFNNESTELFAGAEADITAATELTTTLMKSLMGDGFNPRVERVMRFSLFVLFSANIMSLGNLKRFLLELEYRQQVIDHVEGKVPHNISHFFATDFNEIKTAFYNEGLLPIIAIIDELELQPAFLQEGGLSLQKTVNENFLTVFSLNKISMGEKVVKTVSGLLIQQIFLLSQSRAFNQKTLMFIDEVSVVQTPALASILSEARKFNLFVILTQQYFTQVDKSLKDSIFANVNNYYCFRVSEEDAEQLVGNLPMELPKDMLIESKAKGIDEKTIKARMLTELNPRECIVRVASNGVLLPCFKARTLDTANNVIETFVPDGFVAKKYHGTPVTIEQFYEKAAAVPAGEPISLDPNQITPALSEPIVDSVPFNPDFVAQPEQKYEPPPLDNPPSVELDSPQTTKTDISLDEIMQQGSSKGSEKQS